MNYNISAEPGVERDFYGLVLVNERFRERGNIGGLDVVRATDGFQDTANQEPLRDEGIEVDVHSIAYRNSDHTTRNVMAMKVDSTRDEFRSFGIYLGGAESKGWTNSFCDINVDAAYSRIGFIGRTVVPMTDVLSLQKQEEVMEKVFDAWAVVAGKIHDMSKYKKYFLSDYIFRSDYRM